MAFVDQYSLATSAAFLQRVEMALTKISGSLLISGTPTSPQRAAAQKVLDDPTPIAVVVAKAIVHHASVAPTAPSGTGLTDAQLETAVQAFLAAFTR